jgi:hypothetical protein
MATISRKHLLVSASALIGGATAFGAVDSPRVLGQTLPVYRLDNSATPHSAGCVSCNACAAHAANKYFATATDADLDRAHVHCKCVVVEGEQLPYPQWVLLFGGMPGSTTRASVDLRSPGVAEVLAPREIHVRTLRVRLHRRLLAVDLKLTQAARIEVHMAASPGAVYASKWLTAPQGMSRKGVSIPPGAPAGPCLLTFVVHPASGKGPSRTLTRHVTISRT